METQDVVFALAAELGITLEQKPYLDDLVSARGYFAFNSDDINAGGLSAGPRCLVRNGAVRRMAL
jgi:hypothetical protein